LPTLNVTSPVSRWCRYICRTSSCRLPHGQFSLEWSIAAIKVFYFSSHIDDKNGNNNNDNDDNNNELVNKKANK
jgi:hypothetical protein